MDTVTEAKRPDQLDYQARRVRVNLRKPDWTLLEYAAMDDGRSMNGQVAFLIRELCHAARRGEQGVRPNLAVWIHDGGIVVEHR